MDAYEGHSLQALMRMRLLPIGLLLLLAACTPATPGDAGPFADKILVTSPTAFQSVTSPLTVTGEARGTWYFEASFPVKLFDGNMNQITVEPAQAQGDWMTEDFVPISVTLTFTNPGTPNGFLLLQRDNPSGMPENDGSVLIPVQF